MKRQNTWYLIQSFFLKLLGYDIYDTSSSREWLVDRERTHRKTGGSCIVINYFHMLSHPYRRYELWLKIYEKE